jgi:dolichyl-phosphate-mannose-protein mannosyltransferase
VTVQTPTAEAPRAATTLPRAVRIGVPAAIIGVAAAARLIGLDTPETLVFDETYYVKDAASLLAYGYEGRWPDDANALFEAGELTRPGSDGAFVAHPPLGKWLIALGLAALGTGNPVGWRLSTAIAGIALVALVMVLAHLLLKSFTLSMVAGGLVAIDGSAIVMSRVALLDGLLAVLVVSAVILLVLDRVQYRRRLALRVATDARDGDEHPPPSRRARDDWGPVLWRRPWLIAFGAAFGLATSVKWSALYLFAAFALVSVALDAVDRRRAGVPFWLSGAVLAQGPVSFVLTVPTAFVAHLATWSGWLVTSGGWGRQSGANALAGLWSYQREVFSYHVGESSPHAYEASAALWPLLVRPTYMHYEVVSDGVAVGITGLPNPLVWWLSWAAVILIAGGCAWSRMRVHRGDALAATVVLTGIAAGWLPWLFYPERTTFFFYTIVLVPFLAVGLSMVVGGLLRRGGHVAVIVLGGCAVLISVFFLPVWMGLPLPIDQLGWRYWLPGWV